MNTYDNYLEMEQDEYGNKFNASELSKKFIPFYENQERIKVKFSSGDIKSGRIGITTGWKPSFMLMLTTRSLGSSWLLNNKDKIIV
jgi:hypothetical protein